MADGFKASTGLELAKPVQRPSWWNQLGAAPVAQQDLGLWVAHCFAAGPASGFEPSAKCCKAVIKKGFSTLPPSSSSPRLLSGSTWRTWGGMWQSGLASIYNANSRTSTFLSNSCAISAKCDTKELATQTAIHQADIFVGKY